MPINIIKQTGTTNTTYLPNRSIDYLFIHYAANTSSRRGAAQGIVSWCANPSAGGSADFAVDDETFYQYNGDIKNRYCWAVGGSKYSNLSTNLAASHYGKATNKNSISIEMASNRSMAVVSGLGVTCKSAAAGTTEYRVTNNYNNRIICCRYTCSNIHGR